MDHELFRTPYAVTPTIEERETPSNYRHYADGRELGETMPMWRVQTEGYGEGNGQLIGIVSRDVGFFDSPDVEWISGGKNSKGPNAVAIGRHGNFLLWGFAASPTYLTAEGKLVLVNALHYIARFDHQPPVARKVQGCPPRQYAAEAIDEITDEGYARQLERYADMRAEFEQRKQSIRVRIEAGEEVTESDRQLLDQPPIEDPDRLRPVRSYVSEEKLAELGEDPAAVGAWLREVLPYMHTDGGWYTLAVDEQLMALGLANDDLRMLERAIGLLEAGEESQLARTLLERYTDESFERADEWRAWLDENRERLFFTEVGGYRWLVDRRAQGEPKSAKAPELNPTAESPVASALTLEELGDGRYALTLHVAIQDGWHAYDHVPKGLPYVPLSFELDLPDGVTRDGEWARPASHPDAQKPGLSVFEGRLAFRCELVAAGGFVAPAEVLCELGYQVCDARMCRRPTTRELSIVLGRAAQSSGTK